MQEKSVFMGVTQLPLVKENDLDLEIYLPIDFSNTKTTSSPSLKKKSNNIYMITSDDFSNNSSKNPAFLISDNTKIMNLDNKHDTRIVNENFQV
jgi:hypothetical protein